MWRYIGNITEDYAANLWLRFKDMPFIFDDEGDGDCQRFLAKRLDPDTKWYQINNGNIMLSDFKLRKGATVWHTLVAPGELSYIDAWDIMLDAFDRFNLEIIVSGVPANHPRALRAAEKAGFIVTKITPNFFERFGKKQDMHFMAINREIVMGMKANLASLRIR